MNQMDEHHNLHFLTIIQVLFHSIMILAFCIVRPPWETGDYRYLLGYIIGLLIFAIGMTIIRRILKRK